MAKNEDGEIELVLVNRQLAAVFFIIVVLLALAFFMGYVVGRGSAPEEQPATPPTSSSPEPSQTSTDPLVVSSATEDEEETEPAAPVEPDEEASEPEDPPAATASQTASDTSKSKQETAKQQAKAVPPPPAAPKPEPAKPAAGTNVARVGGTQAPARSAPITGRTYLQVSATDGASADELVAEIRSHNYPAIAAPVEGNPALFRVLVGPMDASAVDATRAALIADGVNEARDSIRRVF